MMFTFTGKTKEKPFQVASITWEDGEFRGSERVVSEAYALARLWEGRAIGFPGGPVNKYDHISNPYAVAWIMQSLFIRKSISIRGKLPEWPEIPAKAIA